MAGYRESFIKTFRFCSSTIPTQWLINITKQKLVVPVYHLISDQSVDHVRHLYPVKKVTAFIKDLDFLLKNYTPIDYFTLEDFILNEKIIKKSSFLLTFDDGLSEFHDVIAPILLKKGIPAICFLNSDFIDNKKIFYRYKASLLINAFSNNEQWIKNKKVLNWLESQYFNQQKDIRKTILSINFQNQHLLDELAHLLDLDFNQYLLEKQPYLTSNQIFSLQQQGFHFGAHSCDHPEYQFLSLAEQLQQTKVSVEKITQQFSLPYKIFAFPFTDYGVSKGFFQIILEKEHIVDISFGCAGLKHDAFPRHIQRIPFEMNHLSAKEIINTEYIYFLIKSFLGKNVIARK